MFIIIIIIIIYIIFRIFRKETYITNSIINNEITYDDTVYDSIDKYEKENYMKIGIEFNISEKINLLIPSKYINNFSWVSNNNPFNRNLILTEARNQGKCWCCYAFTTTEILNSLMYMYYQDITKPCFDFSIQQIIDCTSSPDGDGSRPSKGCYTGSISSIIKKYFNTQRIMATNTIYPYISGKTPRNDYDYSTGDERCQNIYTLFDTQTENFTIINELELINIKNESCVRNAVYKYGCVYAAFYGNATNSFWKYPLPGETIIGDNIYTGPKVIPNASHALLIVGWGVDSNNIPYWLAKNSWGGVWGVNKDSGLKTTDDNGYIRIIRNQEMFQFYLSARVSRPCIPLKNSITLNYQNLFYNINTAGIITVKVNIYFKVHRIDTKLKITLQMRSSIPKNSTNIICNSPNNGISSFKPIFYKEKKVDINNEYYYIKYTGDYVKSDVNNGLYFYTTSQDPIILYGTSNKSVLSNKTPTGTWYILLTITDTINNINILQDELEIDMAKAQKKHFYNF